MNAKFIDLFPLLVFQDKIILSQSEKQIIIDFILNNENVTKDIKKRKEDAWLGDTKGQEYLFKSPIMEDLANLVGEKIKLYT